MSVLKSAADSIPAPACAQSRFDWTPIVLASIGATIAVTLNVAIRRGVPLVGWDGFNYLEEARHLAAHLPNHVGGIYPYGYPLIASTFVRGGVSPYVALVCLSAAAYWLLLYLLTSALDANPSAKRFRYLVPFLSFVPAMFLLAADVAAEMTFSAVVLAFTIVLTRWERVAWIYATVPLFALAFAARYAGIFLIPAALLWVAYDRGTQRTIPLKHAATAIAAAIAVDLYLIYTNILATGYGSGGPRALGDRTLSGILLHCADLGLGPIADLSSGAFGMIAARPAAHMILGLAALGVISWLAILPLIRRRADVYSASAVIVLAYAASIILLQSVSFAADQVRFFVPIVAPLLILAASQIEITRPRAAAVGAIVLFAIAAVGIITTIRGVSPETYGNVAGAARLLRDRVTPSTRIFVNDYATSLAARIDADMFMVVAGTKPQDSYIVDFSAITARKGDYLVIASVGTGRFSSSRSFPPHWISYLRGLEQDGKVSTVLQNHDVIVARYVR